MKVVLLILFLFAATCEAVENNYVDENVWMVKTQGTWSNKDDYGYFKIIVLREIGEHGADKVLFQMLKVKENSTLEVVKIIEIPSPGYKGYVKDVSFVSIHNGKYLIALDIEMKAMNGIVLRDVFQIFSDGTFKKIVNAKYVDIE